MKPEPRKATLRGAVYTRVSTEHGLDQEFNSLDNQRESSPLIARVESSSGSDMKRENDHKDCFKHCAAGQNGITPPRFSVSCPPLVAETNLSMSERNDKLAAHRSVEAVRNSY